MPLLNHETVYLLFSMWVNFVLLGLSVLFARHAFRSLIPYGWI